jgi:hypothetical protein
MNTHKAITIGLAVACVVLAVVSGVLAFLLSQRTRFVSATDKSPFIMFDRGTAEACWSGPPDQSIHQTTTSENLIDKGLAESQPKRDSQGRLVNNMSYIPFCKDLK